MSILFENSFETKFCVFLIESQKREKEKLENMSKLCIPFINMIFLRSSDASF